ncbi:MAG: DUF2961 domain-containing protein [Candidatus Hydrogenedens sp.]|nr:DUF2961 domain-containing protein [Candidatus Hydrogenedens sp.]
MYPNPLEGLYQLRNLQSRAASAENPTAAKGAGGQEGNGLKGAPAIKALAPGATATLMDAEGPGLIRHIWMTTHARDPFSLRNTILRMYWEGSESPSVEAPISDFFGVCHGILVPMYSALVTMQEGRGFNCYIPMPFARRARITIENQSDESIDWIFYQVDFTLGDDVQDDAGRFHAVFRRENPCPLGHDFTLLETGGGRGIYLGTSFGIRPRYPRWWGEGEVKMYIDGDTLFPTICGTGTEDYIGSAWGLAPHCTPYQGAPLHTENFTSMYRFHVPDPVYFQQDIKVTVQQMSSAKKAEAAKDFGDALIFQPKNHPDRAPDDGFYLRSDDWCATAYWYQWPLRDVSGVLPAKEERSKDLFNAEPQPLDAGL